MEITVDFKVIKEKIIKTDQIIKLYVETKKKYTELEKNHVKSQNELNILTLENEKLKYESRPELQTDYQKLLNNHNKLKREHDVQLKDLATAQQKYQTMAKEFEEFKKASLTKTKTGDFASDPQGNSIKIEIPDNAFQEMKTNHKKALAKLQKEINHLKTLNNQLNSQYLSSQEENQQLNRKWEAKLQEVEKNRSMKEAKSIMEIDRLKLKLEELEKIKLPERSSFNIFGMDENANHKNSLAKLHEEIDHLKTLNNQLNIQYLSSQEENTQLNRQWKAKLEEIEKNRAMKEAKSVMEIDSLKIKLEELEKPKPFERSNFGLFDIDENAMNGIEEQTAPEQKDDTTINTDLTHSSVKEEKDNSKSNNDLTNNLVKEESSYCTDTIFEEMRIQSILSPMSISEEELSRDKMETQTEEDKYKHQRQIKSKKLSTLLAIRKAKNSYWLNVGSNLNNKHKKLSCARGVDLNTDLMSVLADLVKQKLEPKKRRKSDSARDILQTNKKLLKKARQIKEAERRLNYSSEPIDSCYESQISYPPSIEAVDRKETFKEGNLLHTREMDDLGCNEELTDVELIPDVPDNKYSNSSSDLNTTIQSHQPVFNLSNTIVHFSVDEKSNSPSLEDKDDVKKESIASVNNISEDDNNENVDSKAIVNMDFDKVNTIDVVGIEMNLNKAKDDIDQNIQIISNEHITEKENSADTLESTVLNEREVAGKSNDVITTKRMGKASKSLANVTEHKYNLRNSSKQSSGNLMQKSLRLYQHRKNLSGCSTTKVRVKIIDSKEKGRPNSKIISKRKEKTLNIKPSVSVVEDVTENEKIENYNSTSSETVDSHSASTLRVARKRCNSNNEIDQDKQLKIKKNDIIETVPICGKENKPVINILQDVIIKNSTEVRTGGFKRPNQSTKNIITSTAPTTHDSSSLSLLESPMSPEELTNIAAIPFGVPLETNQLEQCTNGFEESNKTSETTRTSGSTPVTNDSSISQLVKTPKMLQSLVEASSIKIASSVLPLETIKMEPIWTGGFKRANMSTITEPTSSALESPMSPPPSAETSGSSEEAPPLIIPMEPSGKLEPSKAAVLFHKLITYSMEDKAVEEVVRYFKNQEDDHVANLILARLLEDVEAPCKKSSPSAPPLTDTQRVLFGFLLKLHLTNENLIETYLQCSEKHLLRMTSLKEIDSVIRLYVSICKYFKYMERVRRMCCDAFYFMGDFAIPFFFTVLTLWIEVLPRESHSSDFSLVGVMVQIIHLKSCNEPGYNLMPLRELLHKYYGYPKEPSNSDQFFKTLFTTYTKNPVRPNDYPLLLYCKNNSCQWTLGTINKLIRPLITNLKDNENFKATVILLIANILNAHKGKENVEKLQPIRLWIRSLIEDENVSNVVKRSAILSLRRIPKCR